MLILAYRKNLV